MINTTWYKSKRQNIGSSSVDPDSGFQSQKTTVVSNFHDQTIQKFIDIWTLPNPACQYCLSVETSICKQLAVKWGHFQLNNLHCKILKSTADRLKVFGKLSANKKNQWVYEWGEYLLFFQPKTSEIFKTWTSLIYPLPNSHRFRNILSGFELS